MAKPRTKKVKALPAITPAGRSPFDPARLDNPVDMLLADAEQANHQWRLLQPLIDSLLATTNTRVKALLDAEKLDTKEVMAFLGSSVRLAESFSKTVARVYETLAYVARIRTQLSGGERRARFSDMSEHDVRAFIADTAAAVGIRLAGELIHQPKQIEHQEVAH